MNTTELKLKHMHSQSKQWTAQKKKVQQNSNKHNKLRDTEKLLKIKKEKQQEGKSENTYSLLIVQQGHQRYVFVSVRITKQSLCEEILATTLTQKQKSHDGGLF